MESKTGQKIVESNGQSWLLVEPPNGMIDCKLSTTDPQYIDFLMPGSNECSDDLPPGSYTIYGKGSDLNEEQWREIVEAIMPFGRVKRYKDYEYPESGFYKATESGLSLLTHHQFKSNGVVILKVVK